MSKKLSRVGIDRSISSQFRPFTHKSRLLSLDNGFTRDKVLQFCTRVVNAAYLSEIPNCGNENKHIPLKITIEPKIDGLSISLHYKNGDSNFDIHIHIYSLLYTHYAFPDACITPFTSLMLFFSYLRNSYYNHVLDMLQVS